MITETIIVYSIDFAAAAATGRRGWFRCPPCPRSPFWILSSHIALVQQAVLIPLPKKTLSFSAPTAQLAPIALIR